MKIDKVKVVLVGKLGQGSKTGLWYAVLGPRSRLILRPDPDKDWGVSRPPEHQRPSYGVDSRWEAWEREVFASQDYQLQIEDTLGQQKLEPQWFEQYLCVYQEKIYEVQGDSRHGLDPEDMTLLVKHFVLSQRQEFKRISRVVDAFDNLDKKSKRDIIPESVRIFVWQRDDGKCAECGRKDTLQYDHIIPVAEGGNSTERNVQLLCGTCNARKGKNVS